MCGDTENTAYKGHATFAECCNKRHLSVLIEGI